MKSTLNTLAVAACLITTTATAAAESRISARNNGAGSASASINLRIDVPRVLFLSVTRNGDQPEGPLFNVGLGGVLAALAGRPEAGPDTPAVVLDAATVVGTVADADGPVTVRVWSNGGAAQISRIEPAPARDASAVHRPGAWALRGVALTPPGAAASPAGTVYTAAQP